MTTNIILILEKCADSISPINYRVATIEPHVLSDNTCLSEIEFLSSIDYFADRCNEQSMAVLEEYKRSADVIYEVDFLSTLENPRLIKP